MSDCIFCKIVAEQVPATKVFEDERTFVFMDMYPMMPGHLLVIPKTHVDSFFDLSDADYTAVNETVKVMGRKIKTALNPIRVGVLVKGFDVAHTHVHVFPTSDNKDIISGIHEGRLPPKATEEELAAVAEKIKNAQA